MAHWYTVCFRSWQSEFKSCSDIPELGFSWIIVVFQVYSVTDDHRITITKAGCPTSGRLKIGLGMSLQLLTKVLNTCNGG